MKRIDDAIARSISHLEIEILVSITPEEVSYLCSVADYAVETLYPGCGLIEAWGKTTHNNPWYVKGELL